MRAQEDSAELYTYPALCALTLALIDLVFLYAFFKETLPKEKRVSQL